MDLLHDRARLNGLPLFVWGYANQQRFACPTSNASERRVTETTTTCRVLQARFGLSPALAAVHVEMMGLQAEVYRG